MTDVPEDVRKLARSAALDVFANAVDSDDDSHSLDNAMAFDIIEAAIMADREKRWKVKPLEWIEHGDIDLIWHRATPNVGPVYNVEDDGFSARKLHLTAGQLVLGNFDDLDAAKAAAQADYEARIRSALAFEPASEPVDVDAVIERCAVIAEDDDGFFWSSGTDKNMVIGQRICGEIASAIRALKGRSGTHQAKAALAIALLIATLKALDAKEQSDGG